MNKSYITAAVLALGISAWVVGGYLLKSPQTAPPGSVQAAKSAAPMTVAVQTQTAKPVEQHIVAQGQAEPNRLVTLRAETSGRVSEILADEGAKVSAGDIVARLKPNDRLAKLKRAEARVQERQAAYDASQELGKKGYQTRRQSDEAYSALQTAKAELEEARIELEHTEIHAPFEGVVLTSRIELGTYVEVNGEVATIVDNDPLVVRINIAQHDISKVKPGHPATLTFATGEERSGKVRYVAAQADENTRTFRVEVEVPNPGGEIPSGISAEANIPTGSVPGHFVSPSALSLNDEGVLGVKIVDEASRVEFHPADIIRSDTAGVWIAGLPDRARIITVGQGFVRIGEEVSVAEDGNAPGANSARHATALTAAKGAPARKARQ